MEGYGKTTISGTGMHSIWRSVFVQFLILCYKNSRGIYQIQAKFTGVNNRSVYIPNVPRERRFS